MNQQLSDTLSQIPADSMATSGLELAELYEPPPVLFTIETVGWQILGVVLLLGFMTAVIIWFRNYRRNAYRRAALQAISRYENQAMVPEKIMIVLKRCAIHAFGRVKTAHLFGKEWLQFLEESGKDVRLAHLEQDIHQSLYGNQPISPEVGKELILNARKWINSHAGKS